MLKDLKNNRRLSFDTLRCACLTCFPAFGVKTKSGRETCEQPLQWEIKFPFGRTLRNTPLPKQMRNVIVFSSPFTRIFIRSRLFLHPSMIAKASTQAIKMERPPTQQRSKSHFCKLHTCMLMQCQWTETVTESSECL